MRCLSVTEEVPNQARCPPPQKTNPPGPSHAYSPSLHPNSKLQLSCGLNPHNPSFSLHAPYCLGEITIPTPRWSSASACKLRPWCSLSTCWPRPILRQPTFCPPLQHRPSLTYQAPELPSPVPSVLTTSKLLYSPVFADLLRSMNGTTPSPSPAPASKTSPSPVAGTKRKRTGGAKYYAVKKGYKPGLYYSWNDCLAQVTGFKGAICESCRRPDSIEVVFSRTKLTIQRDTVQSFPTYEDATAFLNGAQASSASAQGSETRFYGIQRGRVPGVYTDWTKAQEQIRGFARPRYKKFPTREEAEEFVRSGQENPARLVGFGEAKTTVVAPGMTSDIPKDANGVEFAPGEGPLPQGAEDGFDPNVLLDPATGKVMYKTAQQKAATKTQTAGIPGMLRIYTDGSSLRNGTKLASAGVGVFFGPGDARCV